MKTSPSLLAALLLVVPGAAPARQPGALKPCTTITEAKLLDFRYSFPTIAGTYPALLAKIREDQAGTYTRALEEAHSNARARKEQHLPFHRHEFWRDWTVTGDVFPLLSLVSHTDFFTGGAHPNHVSSALLWDEKRGATVDVDRLFGSSAVLWKHVEPAYCRKLVAERMRRGVSTSASCRERKELTIAPVDSDFDFKFDSLRIIADPYVAGSYAEGTYVISVPVTGAMLRSIEPEYRESFEAQLQ